MIHFPLFQISPPIFDKFSDSVENFQNVTFSRKNFQFSSAKIYYDLFLVIDHTFRISPHIFSLFEYMHFPMFRENYYFPLLSKIFPPVFEKFTCFLHTLCVFRFPSTLTMMHVCITQCTYWTPLYITA